MNKIEDALIDPIKLRHAVSNSQSLEWSFGHSTV